MLTRSFNLFNLLFVILFAIVCVTPTQAYAAPLQYAGRDDSRNANPQNVGDSFSLLTPVSYGTSYDAQFAQYASFMQSPYSSGAVQQQYPLGGYGQGGPLPGQSDRDPYGASEVSPYSHYSPYVEIVGEGSNYTLGIDDVVTIVVRNQPDFSGRFIVDPEGHVQYPFVGDIKADGKTKGELKKEIIERLKKYVRYPEVAVMISEYRSKAVYVFGFVNRPGKYAMKGDKISVKEAVVAAGLPRMDGSLKRAYVIRPSEYTEDGKAQKKKVNLKKLLQKGDSAENFMLEPGDTIIVEQKYFDKFVNGFSRIVGPVFQAAAVYELGFGNRSEGFLNK